MFAWFWIWRHSSSKLISAWNQASKSIQKLCAKSKRYHAENEHTLKIWKWKAAQNDDQNDDWTMTIFFVSESLQTHPHRESSKMTSLLARNYSFFMAAAACSSVAACSAASAFATAQERWGTHKKRWPFQPCPFADVICLVCRSCIYSIRTCILTYVHTSIDPSIHPPTHAPIHPSIHPVKIQVYIQYIVIPVVYNMCTQCILQGPWVKWLWDNCPEYKRCWVTYNTTCTSWVDFYMVAEQTILVRQSRWATNNNTAHTRVQQYAPTWEE